MPINGNGHKAPQSLLNPEQAQLAQIWAGVIGIDVSDIRASDNFFDLGGDSLLVLRAVPQAAQMLGHRVEPRRYLFENLGQIASSAHAAPQGVPSDPRGTGRRHGPQAQRGGLFGALGHLVAQGVKSMNSSAYALSIDAPVCRYVDLDNFTDLLPAGALRRRMRARREPALSHRPPALRGCAHRAAAGAQRVRRPAQRRAATVHRLLRQALAVEVTRTQFSLSHSQGLALIAIGGRGPLGADVELLRPVPDAAVLAAEYFTHREQEALAALPAHERDRAFLTCWSRKEACLKAIGVGLLVSSQTFEVGLAPERRSVELSVAGRILWLVVGPAPERLDCVGSLAEAPGPKPAPSRSGRMTAAHT